MDDVRKLTQKVAYFITPQKRRRIRSKLVPPGVRFLWGSFQFDGIMESLEESLEFFSPEGKPLRASIDAHLSQQKIPSSRSRRRTAAARPAAPVSRRTRRLGSRHRRNADAWPAPPAARIEDLAARGSGQRLT